MKTYKRALCLLIALILCVSLGACAGDRSTDNLSGESSETALSNGEKEEAAEQSEVAQQPDETEAKTPAFNPDPDKTSETPQPLELVDHGFAVTGSLEDSIFLNFCGKIHNPNETWIAASPTVVVTIKNGDGTIMATASEMASLIMPEDTITLCGTLTVPVAGMTDDASIHFGVEWSDMWGDTFIYSGARTTDFEISNVSELSGLNNLITGEITNNYSENVSMANLSLVLRKDGEIVHVERIFVDNLIAGNTKAFQFSAYNGWPEHDVIEISAWALM